MKKITITIETKGSAFEGENLNQELGRILNKLGKDVSEFSFLPSSIDDVNGNEVGTIEVDHDSKTSK